MDFHELAIDTFTLSRGTDEWVQGDGYEITVLANMDFGNAEAVIVELSAAMAGSPERIDAFGNRGITLDVCIKAETAAGLAAGEEALVLACARARELRWTPPAADGVVTVHDLHWARTEWTLNDLDELGDTPYRTFQVIMGAAPFPRSDVRVVIPAIGAGTDTATVVPTVTTIYSGTGIAGWSAINGDTGSTMPVEAAPWLGVRNVGLLVGALPSLRYSASISMGTNRWLVIRREVNVGGAPAPIYVAGAGLGRTLTPTAVIGADAYYLLPAAGMTITDLRVFGESGTQLTVRSVSRQNAMPIQSTGRQLVRQFTVQGTAPTQGSLALWHTMMSLGDLLVYTWQDDGSGYTPTIDTHLNVAASPARVTDTTAALGGYMTITATAPAVYEVPADVIPEGTYNVMVRAKHPTSGGGNVVVYVKCETIMNGVVVGSQTVFEPLQWAFGEYRLLSVGAPTLPPSRLTKGTAAKVRISISTNTGASLLLDAPYLCNTNMGDLSVLSMGAAAPMSGGSSNRAWIDSPTVEDFYPAIWVGTASDRSDSRHIDGAKSVVGHGHRFTPGQNNILHVSAAYGVAAELEYDPRWQHNAKAVAT